MVLCSSKYLHKPSPTSDVSVEVETRYCLPFVAKSPRNKPYSLIASIEHLPISGARVIAFSSVFLICESQLAHLAPNVLSIPSSFMMLTLPKSWVQIVMRTLLSRDQTEPTRATASHNVRIRDRA